ncbi:MAG: flagellar export protein FliJ [Lachnospiraceae bacterium]|nr:flagellar export protein FliJ [Lachnospiraceae bacterium]MBQ8548904.1 flagellar export protein FliJ [Lachnospiraceae bacterium]
MKKFRYSMQSLLVIKQKLEDQAKAAYGAAKLRLNEEEERLLAMQRKREEYIEEKRQVMATRLDVPKLNRLQMAVEAMDDQIARQKQNVKKAEMAVRAAEERLVESMTERKTQERLRENAFEEYRQEMNAEEQKEIDERTSFRYGTTEAEEA